MPPPFASASFEASKPDVLHQPHDKLIKTGFSDLDVARSFFLTHLPGERVAAIDWSGLQLVEDSFISAHIEASACELLLRVPLASQHSHQQTPLPDSNPTGQSQASKAGEQPPEQDLSREAWLRVILEHTTKEDV